MPLFEAALAENEVILLDGGLATELEAQGFGIDSRLWSAELLQSNPQAIVDAHIAYLEAGARCIISASYQASRRGFMASGLRASAADDLILSSVALAQSARQAYVARHPGAGNGPIVAASIGPYAAMLHDGSEYRGNYDAGRSDLRQFHESRLAVLDASGADVLACETIPDFAEASVLCELLKRVRSPAWVSFCCRDGRHLSDGSKIVRAAALFRDHPRVLAVGVNCTAPQHIPSLIQEVRRGAPDQAIVVYPNSGEVYDATDNSWSGTVDPVDCAVAAESWRDAGAQLIGGCCRMGPQHITAMQRQLSRGARKNL